MYNHMRQFNHVGTCFVLACLQCWCILPGAEYAVLFRCFKHRIEIHFHLNTAGGCQTFSGYLEKYTSWDIVTSSPFPRDDLYSLRDKISGHFLGISVSSEILRTCTVYLGLSSCNVLKRQPTFLWLFYGNNIPMVRLVFSTEVSHIAP